MSQGTINLNGVKLDANDTLIVTLKEKMGGCDMARLERQLTAAFPDNDVILIPVDAGIKIVYAGERAPIDSRTPSKLRDLTKVAGTA